jgi:hypothetical protein
MENFAGFVFRITSRPALQETDRLLDLRVAFLDDRLRDYRQFSENSSSEIIFRSVRAVLR